MTRDGRLPPSTGDEPDLDDDLDLPPTADELARSRKLGDLLDGLVTGGTAPAALAVEQRLLYETARDLYEAGPGLPVSRTRAIVDDVFGQGDGADHAPSGAKAPVIAAATPPSAVEPVARRSAARARARAGWIAAGLAAAGIALALGLVLRAPVRSVAVAPVDPDALLGEPIARTEAAQAGRRIDALVAARQGALRQARHQGGGR